MDISRTDFSLEKVMAKGFVMLCPGEGAQIKGRLLLVSVHTKQ